MASAFVHLREALITGWMGEWRSGSAAALHAVGRGFESLFAYHFFPGEFALFWPPARICPFDLAFSSSPEQGCPPENHYL